MCPGQTEHFAGAGPLKVDAGHQLQGTWKGIYMHMRIVWSDRILELGQLLMFR